MKTIRFYLISGFLFFIGILNAQTDFKPGYIIKNEGDTIYGQIDNRGDLMMSSICRFKDSNNEIKEYTPTDILAFRFTDGKYYIPKELNGKKFFLEYLINGKVSIYYMRDDNNNDHYYIEKDGLQLAEIPYEAGIKNINDKQVFYESKKHIGILNYYMQDAPELKNQIQSIGKPEHDNLIKLSENYHNAVCKDEKCIIYEKKIPALKAYAEIIGGVIKFRHEVDVNSSTLGNFGVIGHFWLPRTSEKVYLRTGLVFFQLKFDNEKTSFFKIPIHLEYIYPKGILRPRISYGVNIYRGGFFSASSNLGGNLNLGKDNFISITTEIEFASYVIIPARFAGYSLQIGLFLSIK